MNGLTAILADRPPTRVVGAWPAFGKTPVKRSPCLPSPAIGASQRFLENERKIKKAARLKLLNVLHVLDRRPKSALRRRLDHSTL